ncbi:MAG: hypothetical protein IH916_12110 [Acidobacteria bacterium]|nr:hypothetical protein [Acidobacteriota bacterium]
MTTTLTACPAPAKLNLFLELLGKLLPEAGQAGGRKRGTALFHSFSLQALGAVLGFVLFRNVAPTSCGWSHFGLPNVLRE